jgi:hypothetical protein
MKTNSTNNMSSFGRPDLKKVGTSTFKRKKAHFPLGKSGWRIVKRSPTIVKES